MKSTVLISVFILLCGLLCFTPGCTPQGTGTLQLNLTDQPAEDEYQEVFITFSQISVHRGEEEDSLESLQDEENGNDENEMNGNGWIVISEEEQGFDLLLLQDGKFELLAEEDLREGIYTQIRLKIVAGDDENGEPKTYVRLVGDDTKYPLFVPSGPQSGLKLIHPFRIIAGAETVLFLDFDAKKSIVRTGNGLFILKPTIAVLSEFSYKQGIKGQVVSAAGDEPVGDATVAAYAADSGQNENGDGELPVGSIATDETGNFTLPLPAGTYSLEVAAEGYQTKAINDIIVVEEIWNTLTEPIVLDPS